MYLVMNSFPVEAKAFQVHAAAIPGNLVLAPHHHKVITQLHSVSETINILEMIFVGHANKFGWSNVVVLRLWKIEHRTLEKADKKWEG